MQLPNRLDNHLVNTENLFQLKRYELFTVIRIIYTE